MCLAPPPVRDSLFSATLEAMACRPSWTLRNIFKSKAGVPRRTPGSAKINLNDYWGVLEQLVHVEAPPQQQQHVEEVDMANEINENLSNERQEEEEDERLPEQRGRTAAPRRRQQQQLKQSGRAGRVRAARLKVQQQQQQQQQQQHQQPGLTRSPLAAVNGIENHHQQRSHSNSNLSPLTRMTESLALKLGRLV